MKGGAIGCVLALTGLLSSPGLAADPAELPAAITAKIDAMFAAYDRDGSPGYAIGIVKDGRLAFARGYGRADLDHDIPITPHTSFHLASLSKQFTAAAVAQLILDGKLSLETPVERFFPEIRRFGADLRIKHLIYFTSGLPDYTSLKRSNGNPWFSPYSSRPMRRSPRRSARGG
jgi:CubicO group peptidase (beta-lactamase class C family)